MFEDADSEVHYAQLVQREHVDDPGGSGARGRVLFALHGRGELLRAHAGGGMLSGLGASDPGGTGIGAIRHRVDRGPLAAGTGPVRADAKGLGAPWPEWAVSHRSCRNRPRIEGLSSEILDAASISWASR